MATAAAELFVKVSADTKGLTSGLDAAKKAAQGLGKDMRGVADGMAAGARQADVAASKISGSLKGAGNAAAQASERMSGFGKALAVGGIVAAGAAMGVMAKQAVTLASELEQNKVAFTTMLGSAQKADALLRDLATFAANTPFELRGLVDSSKRLMAFGFDAKAIIPVMEGVGNAVAAVGGGKETLDGVTMALGQMAAKGKVSAEEMNQLAERGIPAWKMLADSIGVSVPQAMKMAEKGSIDAGTAISALINGMNEKFPGMMDKQSRTFAGALSNLQDSADAALTKIGQKIIEVFRLTDIIRGLSDAIGGITNAITTGGLLAAMDKAFGPAAKATILGVGVALTGALTPAILAAVPAIGALALAWAPAVIAAGKFIAVGVAVAALAYPIIKNWDGIKGTITALFDTAATYASAWYNRASRVFSDFASVAGDAIRYVGDWIRNTFGVDIAAKLGVGMAKAGAAFRGFKQMAVEGLGIVTDSVTYAAQNFAADFTVGFNQGAAAVKAATGKITADMLGLAKNTEVATGAAKRKGDALKQAAQEAKKADTAFARLTATNQKAYERFELMAMSLTALGKRLQAVDLEAANQGRSFDLAGAKAKAYKDSVSAIESAFGKMSTQAVQARAEMETFAAASANGGAATAAAFGVIDEATKGLETQAAIAKALGKDYDALGESIKSAEGVLTSLIEKGLKPGNAAYDEAAKRLAEVRAGLAKKIASVDDLTKGMGDLFSQTNSLLGQLRTLTDAFGVEGASAAIQFAQAGLQVGSALAAIPGIIAGIGSALTALSALFVANPILAAILAIVGAVAIVGGAMYAWWQSTQEESRKAAEEMRKIEEEALRIRATLESSIASGIKAAAKEFLNGTASWGEALRGNMRDGLIDGVIDALVSQSLVKGLADLFEAVKKHATDPMSQAFKDSVKALKDGLTDQLQRLEPALVAVRGVVNEVLPAATKKMDEDRAKVAAAAAGTVRASVDQGSRAAVERYLRAQMDAMDRFRNMGLGPGTYEYEVARDQAEAAARQLRGMATGGLVVGPTVARMGEGGRSEAVLPLNDSVYRQLGEGIASARGGGSGVTVNVNYSGNGKWTREDAQGLGRMMVAELRALGVR